MELYIEKEFLDCFNNNYIQNEAGIGQQALLKIFKEYADVDWFIDCEINTPEQLLKLKIENQFFAPVSETKPPKAVKSIKEHFFENSKCEQTLIFTQNNNDWFNEAERKGAICFSYDNYQQKIEKVIEKCHFKIDLSEGFQGWEQTLQNIQELMPLNKIIINDNYLLDETESYEQKLYPLIKAISKNKKTKKHFYTNILNYKKTTFNIELIYNLLKEKYPTSEIKIIHNNVDNLNSHDRLLYSNHYIIDCAIGFNFNQQLTSNSQIIIETIFEKYTYNRLRNHLRKMGKHFQNLITDSRVNAYCPN